MDERRVRLEPLDVSHAPALFAVLNHDDVGRYIGGPDVTTEAALVERIKRVNARAPAELNHTWLNYVVLVDDVVVGRVEATVHADFAEIAYLIGPAYWGCGFATEATSQLLELLAASGTQSFWATVDPDNAASIGVLRRLGFQPATAASSPPIASYDEGDLVFTLEHSETAHTPR